MATVLGLLLGVVACSSSSTPPAAPADAGPDAGGIGRACSGVPGECGGGTSCLARSFFMGLPDAGQGCSAMTRFCSITCNGDPDCAPYGVQYKCKPGCNFLPSTCDTP